MVDLYPKGVWFQKCFKIFTQGTMQEVPERVLRTVRASVSTKNEFAEKRVKIGVLVVGKTRPGFRSREEIFILISFYHFRRAGLFQPHQARQDSKLHLL